MRLFEKVNKQLDICPRMSQFEQWEKDAKAFKNAKVIRNQLLTLQGRTRIHYTFSPVRRPFSNSITRWMLEAMYVNHCAYNHVDDQLKKIVTVFGKRFRKDKRWIEWEEPSKDDLKQVVKREIYLKVAAGMKTIGLEQFGADTQASIDALIEKIVDARLAELRQQSFKVKTVRRSYFDNTHQSTSLHPLMQSFEPYDDSRFILSNWIKRLVIKDSEIYFFKGGQFNLYYIRTEERNGRYVLGQAR